MHIKSLITAAAVSLIAGTTFAAPAGLNIPYGGVMVDGRGMTVYVFDHDKPGNSSCYEDCTVSWLPLMGTAGAKNKGAFSLAKREDGGYQWAYMSQPLYYWAGDLEPGDMKGDGVGESWHVVKTPRVCDRCRADSRGQSRQQYAKVN